MSFAGLTWRQAKALAEKHVERFQKKLDMYARGAKHVRPDECERYLKIWERIQRVATPEGWEATALYPEEKAEISDALMSGDYDDLLEEAKGNGHG